jgi:hypothetical protein
MTSTSEQAGVSHEAWIAIHRLVTEFAYSIDIGNGGDTAELFTEEGWYESEAGRSSGRAAIRRAYEKRAARGSRTARHIFTNLQIELGEDGAYRGRSILLLFGADGAPPFEPDPILVADVEDVYAFDGVTARLQSRRLRSIFERTSEGPVLPLGEA